MSTSALKAAPTKSFASEWPGPTPLIIWLELIFLRASSPFGPFEDLGHPLLEDIDVGVIDVHWFRDPVWVWDTKVLCYFHNKRCLMTLMSIFPLPMFDDIIIETLCHTLFGRLTTMQMDARLKFSSVRWETLKCQNWVRVLLKCIM